MRWSRRGRRRCSSGTPQKTPTSLPNIPTASPRRSRPATFRTRYTCSPTARTALAWPRARARSRSGPRWPAPGSATGMMPREPRRGTLPRAATFWILATLFLLVFFASAAASPLYRVYQARFHFSAATLTAVFAVYVLVLLATLLFFGSVSDYLGRLPVIIAALVFSAAACAAFLAAHGVGALYLARSLQGVAAGLASGPIGAALLDLQPPGGQRAPVVTSVFSTLGL